MNQRKTLMARYVSNAGILLTDGEHAILTDPFAHDPDGLYEDTTPFMRRELMESIKNGWIDMLIITHDHPDHYCAADVEEALSLHRKMRLITTCPVADQLHHKELYIKEDRLTIISGQDAHGQERSFVNGNFCTEVFPVTHEGEQFANVEHLAVWITWQDKARADEQRTAVRILLAGDAKIDETFAGLVRERSATTDWLFAPFPYIGTMRGRRWLRSAGRIENVFAMHFPRREKDEQHWRENTALFCKENPDRSLHITMPVCTGDWYRLT